MLATHELFDLAELVRRVAREEIMARFNAVTVDTKADGTLVTAADISAQSRLQDELARRWPQFALLGEEMPADRQVELLGSTGSGLWCLDPLDGTSNFASGIPFFATSLALIVGGRAQAAVVHDPARDESFTALRRGGAWLNGAPLRVPAAPGRLADAMAMVDLKRLPAPLIAALATASPYRSQRSFGSVALDWCWLAAGRCQLYLHGGQKLWDFAAGQLIAAEAGVAGGLLSTFDGAWLESHTLAPRIGLAAGSEALLRDWRDWIGKHLAT